ncbi:hypothetical protein [uncultured Chryseobacterium sp.]|uniref:hypothetical protein n=1 Tax=uncultured Chryseobacterium sp. TaxID=259322 RepID=UPI0025FA6C4A|nr:hypothetical protein [uncultured Chryseobacterium sp.]
METLYFNVPNKKIKYCLFAHYIVSQYLTKGDLKVLEEKDRKFNFQQNDLNNDGKSETFISFSGPYFCGTGGCLSILLDENMKAITKFTVTTPPFYNDKASKNEWSIIYVKDRNKWKKLTYFALKCTIFTL